MTNLIRYTLGRWLIHAGLYVLPPGRVRRELYARLEAFSGHVQKTLRARECR